MAWSTRVAPWAAAALLVTACERSTETTATPTKPNIVVITVDTLRADRLGCYGYAPAKTPHIDSLAGDGVLVSRSIAAAPLTLPTHTTIFTGLEPPAHGVRDNGLYHVPDEATTLAELLKARGYRTQAFVSAMVLHRRYNLSQGFEGYDDELWGEADPMAFQFRERTAERTTDRVLSWLDSNVAPSDEGSPFFLWVHYFDPHAPHAPPPDAAAVAATPYDGEVVEVDRHIGRLLGALKSKGAAEDTIVVFTSDHGESLGEHGEKTHAIFIYESTVRVPLIVRYPRALPPGKTYAGTVRSVDILPTVLGLAGLEPTASQGVDLSAALASNEARASPPQYSESLHPQLAYGMAPLQGLRVDEWTYIRAPTPELYDRTKDPGETRNLLDPSVELAPEARKELESRASSMDQLLDGILERVEAQALGVQAKPLDDQTADMLRSLGYMGDEGAEKGLSGMDPKDGLPIYARIEEGRRHHNAGEYAECVNALASVLKRLPKNTFALNTLAACELKLGELAKAERHYVQSLAAEPRQHLVLVQLGRMQLAQGRPKEARKMFADALGVLPSSVEAMSLMGYLEQSEGHLDAAKSWFQRSIATDPKYPQPYLGLGDIELRAGNVGEARRWYEQGLAAQPQNFRASLQAGVCALRMGDTEAGEAHLVRAAELDPDSWFPLYTLASVRAARGQRDDALDYLEQAVDKGFDDRTALLRDPNLKALAGNPRFEKLVRRLTPN